MSSFSMQGAAGVMELASSALTMFAQRPGAGEAFAEAGTAPVIAKLLSPMYAPVAVVNVANAAGAMAADADFRVAFRAGGGVGALTRLLRSDCEPAVQVDVHGAGWSCGDFLNDAWKSRSMSKKVISWFGPMACTMHHAPAGACR